MNFQNYHFIQKVSMFHLNFLLETSTGNLNIHISSSLHSYPLQWIDLNTEMDSIIVTSNFRRLLMAKFEVFCFIFLVNGNEILFLFSFKKEAIFLLFQTFHFHISGIYLKILKLWKSTLQVILKLNLCWRNSTKSSLNALLEVLQFSQKILGKLVVHECGRVPEVVVGVVVHRSWPVKSFTV